MHLNAVYLEVLVTVNLSQHLISTFDNNQDLQIGAKLCTCVGDTLCHYIEQCDLLVRQKISTKILHCDMNSAPRDSGFDCESFHNNMGTDCASKTLHNY